MKTRKKNQPTVTISNTERVGEQQALLTVGKNLDQYFIEERKIREGLQKMRVPVMKP
jgi:hypothetical protein